MVNVAVWQDIIEEGKRLLKKPHGIERELLPTLYERKNKETIEVIYGVRRAGKSTLLLQLGSRIKENVYYINFEDNRLLGADATELSKLEPLLEEKSVLLLDEMQNMWGWEKFVNRMQRLGHKIYISGSNSSLLKGEYASALTGRTKKWHLTPFSFLEYSKAKNKPPNLGLLEKYLREGGFPYNVINGENLCPEYFTDILYRDVISRYNIKEKEELVKLASYVLQHPGSIMSSTRLSAITGLSRPTTLKFLFYLEEVFLLFTSLKYGKSLKVGFVSPKKVYPIDNCFAASKGQLLEAVVAQHVYRKQGKLWYWREQKSEIDIVTSEYAIQVVYEITADNIKRELKPFEHLDKKPLLVYMYSDVDLPEYAVRADHFLKH